MHYLCVSVQHIYFTSDVKVLLSFISKLPVAWRNKIGPVNLYFDLAADHGHLLDPEL